MSGRHAPSAPRLKGLSIAAGEAWKSMYQSTEEAVKKAEANAPPEKPRKEGDGVMRAEWELDRSSIFAQLVYRDCTTTLVRASVVKSRGTDSRVPLALKEHASDAP